LIKNKDSGIHTALIFIMPGKEYIILLFLSLMVKAGAQMPPYYTKHNNYEYAINPAITGRDYYPVINLSHKNYWLGTKDSPSSTCIGGTFRMGKYSLYTPKMLINTSKVSSRSRMGVGGFLIHEKDGPLSYKRASVNYAYYIPFNHATEELSFGISAQLFHYAVDEKILNPMDSGDEKLINLNDQPYIPEAGCGIYYHSDQLSFGVSVNDLILSDLSLTSDGTENNKRDLFISVGYKFFLKRFELEPTVWTAQIDEMPLYYYTGLKLYYLTYNWFSVAYKSTQMLSYSFGLSLNRFKMVYVYEHSVSEMITYYTGNHEIMLGINIGLYEPEGIRKLTK